MKVTNTFSVPFLYYVTNKISLLVAIYIVYVCGFTKALPPLAVTVHFCCVTVICIVIFHFDRHVKHGP
jgi:hypothetical protein